MSHVLIITENILQALTPASWSAASTASCASASDSFRGHARHQFRAGRVPDARHVRRPLLFAMVGLGQLFGPALVPWSPLAGRRRSCIASWRVLCTAPAALAGHGHPRRGHRRRRALSAADLTLGLSLILANGGLILFGSTPQNIRTPLSRPHGRSARSWARPLACSSTRRAASPASSRCWWRSALALFISRSRRGKMLRAAADNPEAATYMGIDVDARASPRVRARHRASPPSPAD